MDDEPNTAKIEEPTALGIDQAAQDAANEQARAATDVIAAANLPAMEGDGAQFEAVGGDEVRGDPAASQRSAADNLPRWRCHKEVSADRIKAIRLLDPERDTEVLPDGDSGTRWDLAGGTTVVVSNDLIARGTPRVGDYFVIYADGYESWSPRGAFEEGYDAI